MTDTERDIVPYLEGFKAVHQAMVERYGECHIFALLLRENSTVGNWDLLFMPHQNADHKGRWLDTIIELIKAHMDDGALMLLSQIRVEQSAEELDLDVPLIRWHGFGVAYDFKCGLQHIRKGYILAPLSAERGQP